MSRRLYLSAFLASALALTACGSDKVVITTPSAKSSAVRTTDKPTASATDEAAVTTLDPSACGDLVSAKLDLTLATTTEEAQKAADALTKFDPPAEVKDALDHFVQTKGAQYDDPDFNDFNARIEKWSSAVCPT